MKYERRIYFMIQYYREDVSGDRKAEGGGTGEARGESYQKVDLFTFAFF